jgi:hypothetical protein
VQQAILATEIDDEESQAEDQEQPPIPIAELPAKVAAPVERDVRQQQAQLAIPITELPAENGSAISPHGREEQGAAHAEEPERQPGE